MHKAQCYVECTEQCTCCCSDGKVMRSVDFSSAIMHEELSEIDESMVIKLSVDVWSSKQVISHHGL